jgi:hypothetical protein
MTFALFQDSVGMVSGRVSLESQDTVVPGLVAADTDELI